MYAQCSFTGAQAGCYGTNTGLQTEIKNIMSNTYAPRRTRARPSARRASGPAPPARSASGGTPAPRTLGAFMRPGATPGMSPSNPHEGAARFPQSIGALASGLPSLARLPDGGGPCRRAAPVRPRAAPGWVESHRGRRGQRGRGNRCPTRAAAWADRGVAHAACRGAVPCRQRLAPAQLGPAGRVLPHAGGPQSLLAISDRRSGKGLSYRWRSSRRLGTVLSLEPTRGTSSTFQVGDGSGSNARAGSTCCACW